MDTPAKQRSSKTWLILAGIVLAAVYLKARFEASEGIATTSEEGLEQKSLPLAAHTVYGKFVEEDPLGDDTAVWKGSAAVIKRRDKYLVLVTNRHVPGLNRLMEADLVGDPEIRSYALDVVFASGRTAHVYAIAYHKTQDLALLYVKSEDLQRDRDYTLLRISSLPDFERGTEVVAVGSPFGVAGTQTGARISAIHRDESSTCIQVDATLNPGNSGGPIFAKDAAGYHFIGVNTFGIKDTQGVCRAISSRHILDPNAFSDMIDVRYPYADLRQNISRLKQSAAEVRGNR